MKTSTLVLILHLMHSHKLQILLVHCGSLCHCHWVKCEYSHAEHCCICELSAQEGYCRMKQLRLCISFLKLELYSVRVTKILIETSIWCFKRWHSTKFGNVAKRCHQLCDFKPIQTPSFIKLQPKVVLEQFLIHV